MRKWTCSDADHIERVTVQCLLKDWKSIWNHESNGELRQKRKNPNLLFKGCWGHPGDVLVVSDPEVDMKSGATTQNHLFKTAGPTLHVRLRILDGDRLPVKLASYSILLEGESQPRSGRTDGKGQIVISGQGEKKLLRGISKATLTVRIPGKKRKDGSICGASTSKWELRIGALNPILEEAPDAQCVSGIQQRLNNLGFLCGPETGSLNDDTREAIRCFQKTYGSAVDGQPSIAVQKKLAQIHDQPDSIVPPVRSKETPKKGP